MKLSVKKYQLGGLTAEYLLDEDTKQISLILLPPGKESCYEKRREWLEVPEMVRIGMDKRAWEVGALCHLSYGGAVQGKGAGETLKHGPCTRSMKYKEQIYRQEGQNTEITTILESDEKYQIQHVLSYTEGDGGVTVQTIFCNQSSDSVTLDLLTSVSLDNLSPFDTVDGEDRIVLHRFYGGWSLEGKHREDFLEELNLERSWFCAFPESERFGSVGSYPVHRYFPMACVEDRKENVFWGIQLEAPSSWQMELSRDSDCCSFSAGIADVEFGNWYKTVQAGEKFASTKARVSAAYDLDDVCRQILNMHHRIVDMQPESELNLPIIFNDWCSTYGEPSHAKTMRYAELLEGSPVKYIVIDAGWTESPENSFGQGGNGDWNYSKVKFSGGLKETSLAVREKGFLLGLWFELEVTTVGARVYEKDYAHLHLTRNGQVINSGGDRTFWDFRKEETIQYLKEKVIDFLRDNQISYLKIDYNASIGIGCDGAKSLGEGLRLQMEAVQGFLKKIRQELPSLVIENCASGGHRLESSFMDLTAMSSFSDAHECKELPYVAANLQRLLLARQNQIWVVINDWLTETEISYRLASGFLGRFCLSGNIQGLSEKKWNMVKNAMDFYAEVSELIKYGKASVFRTKNSSAAHLKGVQVVDRKYKGRRLLVIHSFEQTGQFSYNLKQDDLEVSSCFGCDTTAMQINGKELEIMNMKQWEGIVLLLSEKESK